VFANWEYLFESALAGLNLLKKKALIASLNYRSAAVSENENKKVSQKLSANTTEKINTRVYNEIVNNNKKKAV